MFACRWKLQITVVQGVRDAERGGALHESIVPVRVGQLRHACLGPQVGLELVCLHMQELLGKPTG